MTCLSLLASQKFTQKRYAYLGICILLDEKSEVLLLTSHTIKKDLDSQNQFIVASALNAICEIATPDMCRDSCGEIFKKLSSSNAYIKKKAALALCKVIRSCPELIDSVANKLHFLLNDKNHGVLICGLSLAIQLFKLEPKYIKKNIKFVPIFIKILNILTSGSYMPEFDVNGVTDPFLQFKILQIFAYFGRENNEEDEDLPNILANIPNVMENTTKNTGNAILYELVRTIFAFDSSNALKSMASSILGKFLEIKDNNYKYIAMNSLMDIAKIDLNSVQKHKKQILDFLNDPDLAIKRKSLDLTYLIVNESNIKQIMKECLNFLSTSDSDEFKEELTQKIYSILEKYSPSLKWEIDNLLKMLSIAEDYPSDELINKIINLFIDSKDLHQYIMFRLFISMKSNLDQEALIRVGIYLLGEFGPLIIGVSATVGDNETISITENDIVEFIENININNNKYCEEVYESLMNCCFKLTGKLSSENAQKLRNILELNTKSFYCEVQERANEYIVFSQIANEQMHKQITQNIPINKNLIRESCEKKVVIDDFENENEKHYYENLITNRGDVIKSVQDNEGSGMKFANLSEIKTNNNVQEQNINNTNNTNNNNTNNLFDDINNIFGAPTTQSNPPTSQPTQQNDNNMFNLFNIMNQNNNQPANQIQEQNNMNFDLGQNTNTNTQNQGNDLFSQLGGLYSQNTNSSQPIQSNIPSNDIFSFQTQNQPTSNTMKEVYKNQDISVYSQFDVSCSPNKGIFYISNNSSKILSNVKLNFLVKKHITFKVISTSGNQLEPNASLGIKKDVTLLNNDTSKPIVIKMNIGYTAEGRDINESTILNGI